jgi:molybdopterin molybdotransferase
MITVKEANKIISANLIDLPLENYASIQAIGKVLQEDIMADRDFPPFHRAMMDGIALRCKAWKAGQKRFEIVGTQLAGSPPQVLENTDTAIEIMTGAVCPQNADTIIPIEHIEIEEIDHQRFALITTESVKEGQNIHLQGTDRKKDDILIPKGCVLTSSEMAVLATIGKSEVLVKKNPSIAIISTGDELVDIQEIPLPHQIRRSNVYALQSALKERFLDSSLFHLPDDKTLIEKELNTILQNFDIIILSGGVSQGTADYIPEVLQQLGVKQLFHKVKQRPGKPFWFGKKENKAVFALPGNPVSTVVCFYRFVLPFIYKTLGIHDVPKYKARLESDFVFLPELTYFLPVKAYTNAKGELMAKPFVGQGSGDFANLLVCNAFLELPEQQTHFRANEPLSLIWMKAINI